MSGSQPSVAVKTASPFVEYFVLRGSVDNKLPNLLIKIDCHQSLLSTGLFTESSLYTGSFAFSLYIELERYVPFPFDDTYDFGKSSIV